MKRYIILLITILLGSDLCFSQERSPLIGTYPPQVHQQICQESTFTRFLSVYNEGDAMLIFTASWFPAPVSWVAASPMNGQIAPGDTLEVQFDFNSAGLPLDNYYIDYLISSNDPNYPELPVLAMLHVQDLTILINPEQDTVCSGCSTKLNTAVFGCSEAYSYSWVSNPPGFISTEKSPIVSPEFTTTYTVTVTDGNYSKDGSVQIIVPGTTEIDENDQLSAVKIYPNPIADRVNIQFNYSYTGTGQVRILDLSGRVLYSETVALENGMNELTLQTGLINQGVYLLSVQGENDSGKASLGVSKIVVY